ncbi:MAG TPA: PEGA domain-containing protein [Kofleriaceae bacterium]
MRLATVLARLPGKRARAAELRLDHLLDDVALVAASESRIPPAAADATWELDVTRSEPRAAPRIRIVRSIALSGVAIAAAAVLLLAVTWWRRDPGIVTSRLEYEPMPAAEPNGSPDLLRSSPSSLDERRFSRLHAALDIINKAVVASRDTERPVAEPALIDVAIRVTPATARISIDWVTVKGNPFFGRHPADAELHRIVATAPGYRSRSVVVPFDRSVTVNVSLERADLVGRNGSPVPPRARVADTAHSPRALEGRSPESRSPAPAERAVDAARPHDEVTAAPVTRNTAPLMMLSRKHLVGQVTIVTDVQHGEILIDDVVVGGTPLAQPLAIAAGRHKVTVTAQGFAPATQFINVPAGETVQYNMRFNFLSSGREAATRRTRGSHIDDIDPYPYMLDAP